MIKAVIDIGTNSVRLLVADDKKCILKELKTTRLGEGICKSNIMLAAAMNRTADAVSEFVLKAKKLESEQVYIYATAMVREASNKSDFIELVKNRTGITLEVISGEIEAKIAYLGAAQGRDGFAVIDIGGGSTEVVTKLGDKFNALSLRVGCVRLKESFATEDGLVDADAVKQYVKKHFIPKFDFVSADGVRGLIGVSGTPTTLASFAQNIKTYLPQKVQDYQLSLDKIRQLTALLADMTNEQRRTYSGEFEPRADIIVFGAIFLEAFMEYYGFGQITVSDRDSLEGFLEYKEETR